MFSKIQIASLSCNIIELENNEISYQTILEVIRLLKYTGILIFNKIALYNCLKNKLNLILFIKDIILFVIYAGNIYPS